MSAPSATQNQQHSSTPESDEQALSSLLDRVLERTERVRGEILLTPQGIEFGNFEGLCRWARYITSSGLAPKGIDTFEKALVCIVLGRSVGLDPFQAIQNIAPINGRPVMWGDMPLAVCRQHKDWLEDGFEEYFEVDGKRVDQDPDPEALKKDTTAAVCKTLRRGAKAAKIRRFSMAHAKVAGLTGKNGSLYGPYAQRMLMFRARGYCLRDNFGDALKGIGVRELVDEEPAEATSPAAPPIGRVSLRAKRVQATQEDNGHAEATEPEQAERPGPAAEQAYEEMVLQDMLLDLCHQAGEAETTKALDAIGAKAVKVAKKMGEARYNEYLTAHQARYRELTERQPGDEAEPATAGKRSREF